MKQFAQSIGFFVPSLIILFALIMTLLVSCGPTAAERAEKADSLQQETEVPADNVTTAQNRILNLIAIDTKQNRQDTYVYTINKDTFIVVSGRSGVAILKK
jgi:hypothetical protein